MNNVIFFNTESSENSSFLRFNYDINLAPFFNENGEPEVAFYYINGDYILTVDQEYGVALVNKFELENVYYIKPISNIEEAEEYINSINGQDFNTYLEFIKDNYAPEN